MQWVKKKLIKTYLYVSPWPLSIMSAADRPSSKILFVSAICVQKIRYLIKTKIFF
jgi:hypothetical protein